MKYVALLSGGKDSCFNLLHCHKNGHQLIATASLGPGPGKDELDSFMYQTVGQDAIEYVAKALDVPLYRKIISGSALEQGLEYGTRRVHSLNAVTGDETEDLFDLLSTVKARHPDILGVSVGAILSNYQRIRVEHVCRRLGLTPLCYLWQRDQSELLTEMVEAGMEVILIKVAGIGLQPAHLGQTLSQMRPTLLRLNSLYGSHVCGEGGEYESLTLDCPLFKKRIAVDDTETVIHSDNDFATVAYLRIKSARLVEKVSNEDFILEIPPVLQSQSHAIYEALRQYDQLSNNASACGAITSTMGPPVSRSTSHVVDSWISISNIQVTDWPSGSATTVEDEVKLCFGILQEKLAEYSLDFGHCANINIFLSSMDLFARVNTIYGTFFGVSPPSRACVAVDLPSPTRVRLECTAYRESSPRERTALHVQGLSYWAPANIGPYSQAIISGQRIHISGQIGLVPYNLNLPSPPSLALEFALSCQHVKRVMTVLRENSSWEGRLQATIYWLADSNSTSVAKAGHGLLSKLSPESRAPVIFVAVKELPKGALIEKQVLYHTGRFTVTDEDGEEVTESVEPSFEEGDENYEDQQWHWELSYFRTEPLARRMSPFLLICIRGESETGNMPDQLKHLVRSLSNRLLSARIFYSRESYASESKRNGWCPSEIYIPCRSISTTDVDDWDVAICLMGV